MALLPAETLNLRNRHALQAELVQRVFDLVELERFDDRFNLLHKGLFIVGAFAMLTQVKPQSLVLLADTQRAKEAGNLQDDECPCCRKHQGKKHPFELVEELERAAAK